MNKERKERLKVFCLYLPHEIVVQSNFSGFYEEEILEPHKLSEAVYFDCYKPLLKPLYKFKDYLHYEFKKELQGKAHDEEVVNLFIDMDNKALEHYFHTKALKIEEIPHRCVTWLAKNHYDIFGWLEQEKAINKTNI